MSLVQINRNPSTRQLRQFGGIALVATPSLGWLWGGSEFTIGVLAAVGATVCLLSFLIPAAAKHVFVGFTMLTLPIGIVVGELVLLFIYFVVVFPIGLVFRLMGRDALQRELARDAGSYWQPKQQPSSQAGYLKQW